MATQSSRRAVAVDEDRGVYHFALGAEPFSYNDLRRQTKRLEVIEALVGWAPWRWAVRTDEGVFFVTGEAEPREMGDTVQAAPTCDSCAEAGEIVPAATRSTNPRYSGYQLCAPCAAEYDARVAC